MFRFPAVYCKQTHMWHSFCRSFSIAASRRMSGQMKISGFFSPAQKRPADDDGCNFKLKERKVGAPDKENTDNNIQTEDKALNKTPEKDKTVDCEQSSLVISPEQKSRMEDNRLKAIAKMLENKSSGLFNNVGTSWLKVLESEFKKPYFETLGKFVHTERQKGSVFPEADNVFSWTRACTVNEVKVVILGQDPYHGPNQAHGLSFSVLPGIPAPPRWLSKLPKLSADNVYQRSDCILGNMYKELEKDIEGFQNPKHGYLYGWAAQGVLMLNAVMTVKARQANSHKDKGWEKFTDATISYLNQNRTGLVFMLWGAYAQKKGARIDKKKHRVLTGVHPSPLSAHRGFFGCKHFSKCNDYLEENGKTPIDWKDLPVE